MSICRRKTRSISRNGSRPRRIVTRRSTPGSVSGCAKRAGRLLWTHRRGFPIVRRGLNMGSTLSRRDLLRAVGVTAVGAPLAAAFGTSTVFAQGRCMLTLGAPACNTTGIKPLFSPTGWKTTALDHIAFQVADYQKEAAFYAALMGWTLRSDDGKQAVMDAGNWGSVIFKQSMADPAAPAPAATAA